MRLALSIIFLLQITTTAFSQVKGKVVSAQGEPLPLVNVLLLNATDSSVVTGAATQQDGSFAIDQVASGEYILAISFVGFSKWHSAKFVVDANRGENVFNRVVLNEESTMLNALEVTAQRAQIDQTLEGTTVRVANSMMSKGNTALQILERLPGVVFDPRNNQLMLNGQTGTLIMVNGKPMRISAEDLVGLLAGMSGDNVEKIELLTNPSAKYEADGGAGVINIILKKNVDDGTNGSLSTSLGYGWAPKQAASLNVNHKNGSTNYNVSYSFNRDKYFTNFHGIGNQIIPVLGGRLNFDFKNNSLRDRLSHNATAGVERTMSHGLVLGGGLSYNTTSLKTNIDNHADYTFHDDSFLHADIHVFGKSKQDNVNSTAFLEKSWKEGKRIAVQLDHIYYKNHFPSYVESSYFDKEGNTVDPESDVYRRGNRGESVTLINIGVLGVDYETMLRKDLRLEAGIKASNSYTTNTAFIQSLQGDEWTTDERNQSNMFVRENIGASYLSLHFSLDSLTSITGGVRYEQWDRDFSEPFLDNRLGRFFPSAFISKTLTESTSIQFAYNRRITRPDYNDLTNYLRYNDPMSVFTGTPHLQPALLDNLRVGVQHGDKTLSLFYTHEQNPIARFQIVTNEQSDLIIIAPQNIDYIKSVGAQLHLPIQIMRGWLVTTGGAASSRTFELSYTKVPVKKQYIAYNAFVNQNFSLPKNFSLELSATYNSSQYNGSVKVQGYGWLNAGIKKELKNKIGTIQLTVVDLFESMVIRSAYGHLTTEAFNSKSVVVFKPESANARIFRISYSRNFGDGKSKDRKRGTNASEENSRIGQ